MESSAKTDRLSSRVGPVDLAAAYGAFAGLYYAIVSLAAGDRECEKDAHNKADKTEFCSEGLSNLRSPQKCY